MTLLEQIESDLTVALKSNDNFTRDTLRFLKSVIKNAEINSSGELSDEQIVGLIQKEVKKRLEAEVIYRQAEKPELAQNENMEADVLKQYLPKQMGEGEIEKIIDDYLTTNPTEISQLGIAMAKLSTIFKGQADLGLVSKILRQKISNG
ncbi:MAG: hypothetical protein A3J39_04830 [Sulfuricurvum sp. RIFCSPHIGHO2_12_FULL_44_8]|nr:MAG: hypothetical protein A3J39_04830 [Sulfuricurvum sp. RIFCSPHIGHO2_12_FULL_44_8]